MMLFATPLRILGALVMCAALFGCVRQDALYPRVVPIPTASVDALGPQTPVFISSDTSAQETSQSQPAPATAAESQPAQQQPATQQDAQTPVAPSSSSSASGTSHVFHSYFINREVQSDNIKMFPRWIDMLARYNSEARTLENICGSDPYSPCKLKDWKDFLEGLRGAPIAQQMDAVNRYLNKYPYIDDIVNWGFDNYWETPYEFQRRSGNCKDYAIAKFMSLRALGVPNDIMRVEVVRDLNLGGVIHAVLVVNVGDKSYVLDNQIKQVVLTTKIYHYVPIYSINEQHWWQHFMLE